MFSLQETLNNNPIPSLYDSCEKFLEWTQPLLNEKSFLKTKEIVTTFMRSDGDGEKLQNSLVNWQQSKSETSWTKSTWLDFYLSGRYPLPINSNVFYYLENKLNREQYSQAQIASALIKSVFEFHIAIKNESLSIDTQKGHPLCMEQYKRLFSATRVPHKGKDALVIAENKRHIVILFQSHLFKLTVADENDTMLSFPELDVAIQQIQATSTHGQNIGVLTTQIRDEWAENRIQLQQLNPNNAEQLNLIEDALFLICLDSSSPDSLSETSTSLLHGSGTDRYFDKALQFIVFKNGKTGINFEHTGIDGAVMLRLIGHIFDTISDHATIKVTNPLTARSHAHNPQLLNLQPLHFQLSPELKTSINKAGQQFHEAIANTHTRIFNFSRFGKNQIKAFKLSPDAFLQIALQLAEYNLYGKCTSAYEAVMTRGFSQGRIDVLYTVSNESKAFIESLNDPNSDPQTRISLLRIAAEKHVTRANECRLGMGVHTHFLALIDHFYRYGESLGIDTLPEIFNDLGYQTLTHNIICTSTTSEYGVALAGYGPFVGDGFGIRYFNRPESIGFNITSRNDKKEDLDPMIKHIEQALSQMASLYDF